MTQTEKPSTKTPEPIKEDITDDVTPEGLLGVYLVVGAALIVTGGFLFYLLTQNITAKTSIVAFDETFKEFVFQYVTPPTIQFMRIMTLAGIELCTTGGIILGIYFALRRHWRHSMLMLIGVGGGHLLMQAFKLLIQRDRPVLPTPIDTLTTYSFPSGHALLAVVFYGLVLHMLLRIVKAPLLRIGLIMLTFVIILLVGITRIYLGLHFLSDVLGGYMIGLAWLGCTITGVELFRRWRARRAYYRRHAGTR